MYLRVCVGCAGLREFVLLSQLLSHVGVVFCVMFYLCSRVSEWVKRLHEEDFCVFDSNGRVFISV